MQNRFYRPELDVLRFLAFGMVFLRHTGASIAGDMQRAGGIQALLADISAAGSYGVDLFFLLSAYLITELFIREINRAGTIDIRAFYMRRILRIWPLYFFFIIITLCISRFTPVQFPTGAVIPMFLFYGNWWLMTHAFFSPAGILWSVSIEEQFYLVCPWAARFLSKRSLVVMCLSLLCVAWMARFAILSDAGLRPSALWYCTLTRLDPIAIGMLMALVLRGRVLTVQFPVRIGLLLSGSFCVFAAATWFHGQDADLSMVDGMLSYPIADIGALLIFLSCLGARIGWRPAVYLGHISYGLYVYHLLALNIAKVGLLHAIGVCPFWLRGAIALPLTVGMAALSYAYLEAPFLRLKNRFGSGGASAVPAAPAEAA